LDVLPFVCFDRWLFFFFCNSLRSNLSLPLDILFAQFDNLDMFPSRDHMEARHYLRGY